MNSAAHKFGKRHSRHTRQQSQSDGSDAVHDNDEEDEEADRRKPPPVRMIVAVSSEHRFAQALHDQFSRMMSRFLLSADRNFNVASFEAAT